MLRENRGVAGTAGEWVRWNVQRLANTCKHHYTAGYRASVKPYYSHFSVIVYGCGVYSRVSEPFLERLDTFYLLRQGLLRGLLGSEFFLFLGDNIGRRFV